jgi:hypothetical protein
MRGTPFERRPSRGGEGAGGICRAGLGAALRVGAAALTLCLAAAGLLYLRLLQGPLPLPQAATLAERLVNPRIEGSEVAIGGAVLTLGRRGVPSGLQFTDVRVRGPEGALLLSAPRLAARFHLADLLLGRLQPTRLLLVNAEARVLRSADGRIRVGLGGSGVRLGGGPGPGMDAVAKIVDGFVGDSEPPDVLARLDEIGIIGARLAYEDAMSGRRWRTAGSDLVITRTENGARARMRAALSESPEATTRLAVEATRAAGTGRTEVRLRFRDLQADDIAEQAAGAGWVRRLDAPLAGEIRFAVPRAGGVEGLAGRVGFRDGEVFALEGPARRIDRARLAFRAAGDGALEITRLEVAGAALEAALSGRVAAGGGDLLAPGRLAVQLDLERLALDLPQVFEAPLSFDGGQLVARLDPARGAAEIGHLHLSRGAMTLAAEGRLRRGEGGPEAAFRVSGRELTVEDLTAHWPLGAGENARPWVVEHVRRGRIPEMVGHVALGRDAPLVDLAFRYEGLDSRYLDDMTPIEDASGRGHLTLGRLDLWMEDGTVAPGGAAISLAGSRFAIPDLDHDPPHAEIRVRGSGPTAAVLSLIDEEPLGLVSKLGVRPEEVAGTVEVEAEVRLPLLEDLPIEAVRAGAAADLRAVRLALALRGGAPVEIAAERLALEADTEAMTVEGEVTAAGAPLSVVWRELYGPGRDAREIELDGALTPDFLAARGVDLPGFAGGRAPVEARLSGPPDAMALSAEIDLGPARLAAPALRWEKPAGASAGARLEGTLGELVALDRVRLDAPGLELSGSLLVEPGGALSEAVIERFRLGERADLSGGLRRAADGALDIRLEGPRLDLSGYVEEPPGGATAGEGPMRLEAEIGRLRLTRKLEVEGAEVMLVRTAGGEIKLELSGRAGGTAPFEARYSRRSGERGTARMTSADAGALLRAAGLFEGGQAGRLTLEATLDPAPGADVRATARIREMRVRRAATFGSILEQGGVTDAAEAVQDGGLLFDTIDVPFTYADGVIRLGDSIARSPLLAVKVAGTVDETADRLDLRGVISPAYALTGALDEVPLLGALLSGGRGEGILAMTFRVTGGLDDPDFSVNPLSLLTPGFLRNVFSGRTSRPSEEFLEQLGPGD